MIQRGVVQEVSHGSAIVAVGGGEGCSTCNARESCMTITGRKPDAKLVTVENTLKASVGDAVEIELPVTATMRVIALTFLLPVALLMTGYLVMMPAGSTQGAIGAIGGLVVGMAAALAANKALSRNEKYRMRMTAIIDCTGTDVEK